MTMNYKEIPQGISQKEAAKYAKGIRIMNDLADSLKRQGELPERFSKPETVISTPVEKPVLKTPRASFEIPAVSEELYMKTREALAKEGYGFVVAMEPLSIGQLATDPVTSQRFGYVNPSEDMRGIVPQQMEVAINLKNLRIKNSNRKSTDAQIKMIEDEETVLKGKLPQEVRDIVSMRIQNASVLAQLDEKHQKATGKVLFTDWFGRTDDQTVPGLVAIVGRLVPTHRLCVPVWDRGDGDGGVFAVPVVVLPRKLAV